MPIENHLIILTCTVKTQMTSNMKRSDPQIRLNDYVESIRRWNQIAAKNRWKIVVAENSNSLQLIVDRLKPIEMSNIHFYPAKLDEKSHLYGNSAGEFGILQEMAALNFLDYTFDYVWKITGRLFNPNFPKIANAASGDLVVNRLYASKHQIDSRIIGFSPNQFNKIFSTTVTFSTASSLRSGGIFESMEHYLTQKILDLELSGGIVTTMNQVPIFMGTSGTSNKQIDSFSTRLKKRFSNLLRPLAIKLLAGSAP